MPQMMPMSWLGLPLSFIFCFILLLTILFFLFLNNTPMTQSSLLTTSASFFWSW